MINKSKMDKATVCIIGMGYVGLPLARAFSKKLKVVGFDVDTAKVTALNQGQNYQNLTYTSSPVEISKADFIIICVPTPITQSKEPDLSFLKAAAMTVSQNMKKNCIVILESTVYPGLTEEVIVPILESRGLKSGRDFKIAYSPERINPGDDEHTIEKVTKVVAGMDEETEEIVGELYRKVVKNVFIARDIRTAEAAKVVENIQRDLNISLMNEFAVMFEKMGMSTRDVLDAAATKWNFHRYEPGLVGGHCIPVVPYYLVHKSRQVGYEPRVILAGRETNDFMPEHIVGMTVKALKNTGKAIKGSQVLVMGLTYKEDVADTRDSPLKTIIEKLAEQGVEVLGFDPLLAADIFKREFKIKYIGGLNEVKKEKVDGIIIGVAHSSFKKYGLAELKDLQKEKPVLIDIRGLFNSDEAKAAGFYYKTL